MTFVQAAFGFNGRMRRRDYWIGSILFSIVIFGGEYIGHALLRPGTEFIDINSWTLFEPTPYTLFILGYLLICQWPAVAISVKRWHDRNKTGWFAAIGPAASFGGLALQRAQAHMVSQGQLAPINMLTIVSSIVQLAIGVWFFVELGCLDGTKGPNPYGPSPKGIENQPDVF